MKIKFIQNIIDLLKQASTIKEELFELNLTINANKQYKFKNIEDFKGTAIIDANSLLGNNLKYLFPQLKFLEYNQQNLNNSDNYFIWGTHTYSRKINIAKKAIFYNKPIYTLEMGFLYSATNFHNLKVEDKYRSCMSYTIDSVVPYYDARYASNLEQMLNDKNLIVTKEQKERARNCINKIIETHLTKYNHQPIFEPQIGRKGAKKVLVVDQSYGDMSISKGGGSDFTFPQMLECAIKENPDADIIVKTHPDTMTGRRGGYFTGLKAHDNIYTQTEPINPISLIKYVDKVYVCTTQFGFEALMCGKEVHVFGKPFYSGWGLTVDEQTCERRTNTRSLEEIFYITYILYSHYINPETKQKCELEEAMEYLLGLREEYFNKYLTK
ncbi:MAG: hypothetical protein NC408_07250 [Candidatus Gastranaerophilales bacterium]|nr:hypothetical protein [Candidatus Gastranaerophilales bacterium]MCM1072905.1 hypothetical protein [Bacteroides sp.]